MLGNLIFEERVVLCILCRYVPVFFQFSAYVPCNFIMNFIIPKISGIGHNESIPSTYLAQKRIIKTVKVFAFNGKSEVGY